MNAATIGDTLKTVEISLTEKLLILKILSNIAHDMINKHLD